LITFITTSFLLEDNAESKRKEVSSTEISKRMGERELSKRLVVHVEAFKWKSVLFALRQRSREMDVGGFMGKTKS